MLRRHHISQFRVPIASWPCFRRRPHIDWLNQVQVPSERLNCPDGVHRPMLDMQTPENCVPMFFFHTKRIFRLGCVVGYSEEKRQKM